MKRRCYVCGRLLKKNDNSHTKKCSGLEYKLARYNQLLFDFNDYDLSYIKIKDLYLNQNYSIIDFKNEIGLCFRQTLFLLDYYNIEKRSKSEINTIKRDKYKKTCINKYAIEHSTTNETVNKIKKTCIDKYGVDNIFKNDNFIKESKEKKIKKYGKAGLGWLYETDKSKNDRVSKLHIDLKKWWKYMDTSEKDFRIELLKENRLKWWKNLDDDSRYTFLESIKDNYDSSLEKIITNILNDNNISHKSQYWINRKSYDFKIGNIILEINGDFWHCNPNKYNEDYIHPYIKKTASEIWLKDINKKINAEKKGYEVIYIWEDEIKNTKDLTELVLNKIKYTK